MNKTGFNFRQGNAQKLIAIPQYIVSLLFSLFVPRHSNRWVFGSGIGVGEGALPLAKQVRLRDPHAQITWITGSDAEVALSEAAGIASVTRHSWSGYWETLRARQVVITHGLGDVNRFGIFGATIIHLGHGAPLKLLHLDSPITTSTRAPGPLRALLSKMYRYGAASVDLYIAGSIDAAERLRSAYRVDPGRVQVLGDPRDDELASAAADPLRQLAARSELCRHLGISEDAAATTVLYAPTWRDGEPDPAIPTPDELAHIRLTLEQSNAHLLIRSHPLGAGAYEAALGNRVHLLGAESVLEITPLLSAVDVLITDYSSIAVDFALLGRTILWFAPDVERYTATRGLYEPLAVTAAAQLLTTWNAVMERLAEVIPAGTKRRAAQADSRALAQRFHAFPQGGAAARVFDEILRLRLPANQRIAAGAVFFESFYGRQVSCNPYAIDREIATRYPDVPRYWSVTSERITVPEGAIPVLVGGADWFAVRRQARLLVVNDWLRYGFKRGRGQTVLQTWHGTMLKHLALGRPNVGLRARMAIRRESRRWNLLLSQNPHSSEQFRTSYAFRGEILETGYPRDDRLARATAGGDRIEIVQQQARRLLQIPLNKRVIAYVPTWRDSSQLVDTVNVHALAASLDDDWVIVARGHTRSEGAYLGASPRVYDASAHPDVNDVILAADLLITDFSSVMFDSAVARVPLAFYVPDLASYRDRERGFTFNFEDLAPGPLLSTREELLELLQSPIRRASNYEPWCAKFVPFDDGHAAERVVDALVQRGVLSGV